MSKQKVVWEDIFQPSQLVGQTEYLAVHDCCMDVLLSLSSRHAKLVDTQADWPSGVKLSASDLRQLLLTLDEIQLHVDAARRACVRAQCATIKVKNEKRKAKDKT